MNERYIRTLVHFNFWANGRVLTACKQLTPAQFTHPVTPDPGWGTLRSILVHMLDTEYGWRSVLQQQAADNILQASDFADVDALTSRWDNEKTAWLAYASTLSTETLQQTVGDTPQEQQVWQTIMHVIMHGAQHRGEAAAILTGYGYSPGELDFDRYLVIHKNFFE